MEGWEDLHLHSTVVAALNMASDLAGTPVSGMNIQACGDAHLCNFGGLPHRKGM